MPGTSLGTGEPPAPAVEGIASYTIANTGAMKLAGKLADGTAWLAGGWLRDDGTLPLYTPLYQRSGSISGALDYRALRRVRIPVPLPNPHDGITDEPSAAHKSSMPPTGPVTGLPDQALGSFLWSRPAQFPDDPNAFTTRVPANGVRE